MFKSHIENIPNVFADCWYYIIDIYFYLIKFWPIEWYAACTTTAHSWMNPTHRQLSSNTPQKKKKGGGGVSFGSWAVSSRESSASSRSHVFRTLNMPLHCYCLTGLPDPRKNCLVCELFLFSEWNTGLFDFLAAGTLFRKVKNCVVIFFFK